MNTNKEIEMMATSAVQPERDKLLCPLPVVRLRQSYNVTQNRLFMALVAKLQPVFFRQFKGLGDDPKPVFADSELTGGYVAVDLPLSMVSGKRHDYRNLRSSLGRMADCPIEIPVGDGDAVQWHRVTTLLKVRFLRINGDSHAYVYIWHTVARTLFDVSRGYFFFSRTTFLACTQRSTQMLYLLCERWRKRGLVNLHIATLVRLVQAGKGYRRFSEFRSGKLEVARAELYELFRQHKSTCYFTYQPIYQGSNVCGEPLSVVFRIHSSDTHSEADCAQLRHTVFRMLTQRFNLYDRPAHQLAARVDQWNYPAVIEKLQELYHRYRHRGGINDIRAYTYAVVSKVIKDHSPAQAVEQELPLAA